MSAYREALDSGTWAPGRRFKKWAKRQMSKFRRRWPKHDTPPHRMTKGYYW